MNSEYQTPPPQSRPSLMLKGLKSVDLKIIQMYHFRLKWKRYMQYTNWWDSNFFGVGLQLFWSGTPTFSSGTPTFCQMGVLNSCFQNPSESSDLGLICDFPFLRHLAGKALLINKMATRVGIKIERPWNRKKFYLFANAFILAQMIKFIQILSFF